MKKWMKYLPLMFLTGCAGLDRSCASCNAENFGANYLVVQYRFDGTPINCWKLMNNSVVNEPHSDGIYWKSSAGLVHISGWYNRVQVENTNWDLAAKAIGVSLDKCKDGKYE